MLAVATLFLSKWDFRVNIKHFFIFVAMEKCNRCTELSSGNNLPKQLCCEHTLLSSNSVMCSTCTVVHSDIQTIFGEQHISKKVQNSKLKYSSKCTVHNIRKQLTVITNRSSEIMKSFPDYSLAYSYDPLFSGKVIFYSVWRHKTWARFELQRMCENVWLSLYVSSRVCGRFSFYYEKGNVVSTTEPKYSGPGPGLLERFRSYICKEWNCKSKLYSKRLKVMWNAHAKIERYYFTVERKCHSESSLKSDLNWVTFSTGHFLLTYEINVLPVIAQPKMSCQRAFFCF